MTYLPLPGSAQTAAQEASAQNIGLYLDRFVEWWQRWAFLKEGKGSKRDALETAIRVAKNFEQKHPELIKALVDRHTASLNALKDAGQAVWQATLKTDWRLTIGLGTPNVTETGLTTHRVYGVPYIPASALKGLARAWAETEGGAIPADAQRVFGSEPEKKPLIAGEVMFFDALPAAPPKLKLDIMNPHYGDYYQGREPYPVEWLSPVPVYFLTVENTPFLFSLAARGAEGAEAVALAQKWLLEALENMGAGGKTTAGYGYFSEPKSSVAPSPTTSAKAGAVAAPGAEPAAMPHSSPAEARTGTITEIRPDRHFGKLRDTQTGKVYRFDTRVIEGNTPGTKTKVVYYVQAEQVVKVKRG